MKSLAWVTELITDVAGLAGRCLEHPGVCSSPLGHPWRGDPFSQHEAGAKPENPWLHLTPHIVNVHEINILSHLFITCLSLALFIHPEFTPPPVFSTWVQMGHGFFCTFPGGKHAWIPVAITAKKKKKKKKKKKTHFIHFIKTSSLTWKYGRTCCLGTRPAQCQEDNEAVGTGRGLREWAWMTVIAVAHGEVGVAN